jgi:hypothetical protein
VRGRVGLVVNPDAAHDVRLLTSLAPTVDVHRRVNLVARVISGLAAAGPVEVLYMPDRCRIVEQASRAFETATRSLGDGPDLVEVGEVATDATSTARAAAAMCAAGAACVVTVGGDGTNRAVASGWPDAVFAPLPGGTNNAFAPPVDPTVLGLAAGLYAQDPDGYQAFAPRVARLDLTVDGGGPLIALIDIASVHGSWVGSRAMWDAGRLGEVIVTRADPTLTGLAGIAGMAGLTVTPDAPAVHLRFGEPGTRVLAPLGPGHMTCTSIRAITPLGPGDEIDLRGGVTLAFDGEREVVLAVDQTAHVFVRADGPRVIAAADVVRAAAGSGRFTERDGP